MNKKKLYGTDIESLFSGYLMDGEYIIWCQPTSEKASLTDRRVIEPPSKNREFKSGLSFVAVGIIFILINLFSHDNHLICYFFMTIFIIVGLYMMTGFSAGNKRGAYAITNIRGISLENEGRPRYVYLKDVLSVQIYMLNEEKNIGLLRLFTQFDIAAHKIELVEFYAIDSPVMADRIARKQISIVKRDNGLEDIVPEDTGKVVHTYGSRRLSRMKRRK
ncbi:hypothetical protein [Ruminococcus flavefaciens]|uniref:hypothetical protein n=1 Tax=Ruminococcus flavefaciens TaxID=1265 RepID=UPI0026EA40C8|nr:hypothetical protein [Ruminococcus flavefaciens]